MISSRLNYRIGWCVILLMFSNWIPAQTLRFHALPYRVNSGDAVTMVYVESTNTLARSEVARWGWDLDGDGVVDATGEGGEGLNVVWYPVYDPLRAVDGVMRLRPRLYVTAMDGREFAATNGVTENVTGTLDSGPDPDLLVGEFGVGNADLRVNVSANRRLTVPGEWIRFFADITFLKPGTVRRVDWDFTGGTNFTAGNPGAILDNSAPSTNFLSAGSYGVSVRVQYTVNTNASVVETLVRTRPDFIRVVAETGKLSQGRAYRRGFPEEYDWDDLVKAYQARGADGDRHVYFHLLEDAYDTLRNRLRAEGIAVDPAKLEEQRQQLAELVNELLQGQALVGNQQLVQALRVKYPRLANPDDDEDRLPVPPGVREETAAIDLALLEYQAALVHVFRVVQEFGPDVLRSKAAAGREPFPDFPQYLTFLDPTLSQAPIPIKNEYAQLTLVLDRLAMGTVEKAKKLFRLSVSDPVARVEAKEECKRAGLQGYLGMALLAAGQSADDFALNGGNALLAHVKNARDLFEGINAGLNPLGNDGSFIPNESFGAILQDAVEAVADAREAEVAARLERREFDQRQATLRNELASQRASYISPLRLLTGIDPVLYNNLQTVQDQSDYRTTARNRVNAILRDYPNTTASGAGELGETVLAVLDAAQNVQQRINDLANTYKRIDIKKWANTRVSSVVSSVSEQLGSIDLFLGVQQGMMNVRTGPAAMAPLAIMAGLQVGILNQQKNALQALQTLSVNNIQLEAEIRGILLEVGNLGIAIDRARIQLDQARLRLENLETRMDRLIEDLAHTRSTAENLYFVDPSFRVVVSRAQRRAEGELDFAIDRLYRLARTLEYEWTESYQNPLSIPVSSYEPASLENPLFDKFTQLDSLFQVRTADEAKDYLDALRAWDSKLRRINVTSVRGPNHAGPYSAEPISVREQVLNLRPVDGGLTLADSVRRFREFLVAQQTDTRADPLNPPLEFRFQTAIEDNRYFPATGAEWNLRIHSIRIDLVAESGFSAGQVAEVDLTQAGMVTLRRFFAEPPWADDLFKMTFNSGRVDRSAFTIKVPARINGAMGGRPPSEFEVLGLSGRPVAATDWILRIDTTKPSNRRIDFTKLKDIVIRFTYTYGNPPEFPNF